MKKILLVSLIAFFVFSNIKAQDRYDTGSKFLNCVLQKQWDAAESLFDVSVKSKVSAALLQQIFTQVQTQVGEFKSFDKPANIGRQNHYTGHFSKLNLDIEVNLSDSSKIVGFFFLPVSNLYKLPAYADASKYKTDKITIASNGYELPGSITAPVQTSASKVPLVIFVGGSGPNDMDETMDAEKPFKDLSIGLALNGIASLRYDKRTYVYHNLPGNITIKEEYLDDVSAAIQAAKAVPGVDPDRIFIAGHSLGGMLSPLILKENPSLAGAILLEANARPVQDLMYEQSVHFSKIHYSQITDDDLKVLYATTQKINNITVKDTSESYLNVKGSYWLSLNAYTPLKVAAAIKTQKMLIIQGGYDYQVTKTDFDMWSAALAKKKNVSFKFYPTLNHALDDGKGTLSPAEYSAPANTPVYLANDISAWIKLYHK